MSMMDFALHYPRKWYAEGFADGSAKERQHIIAAIAANPDMTDEAKLQAIASANSATESRPHPLSTN